MTPIIGFLVQCAICPQQVMLAAQSDSDWVCPRCAEVASPQSDCLCPPALGGSVIGSSVPCPVHFSGLSPVEWWQLVDGAHRTASGGFGDVDVQAAEPFGARGPVRDETATVAPNWLRHQHIHLPGKGCRACAGDSRLVQTPTGRDDRVVPILVAAEAPPRQVYPWGDSIPWPPEADSDEYPIGEVTC